jgi:hypothetical protein
MIDRLPAMRSGIDDGSISLGQAFSAGDFRGSPVQMSEHFLVFSLGVRDGSNVLSRDDEDVYWRLRLHVGERVAEIVLVNWFRRDAAVDDLAEDTVHGQEFTGARFLLSGDQAEN